MATQYLKNTLQAGTYLDPITAGVYNLVYKKQPAQTKQLVLKMMSGDIPVDWRLDIDYNGKLDYTDYFALSVNKWDSEQALTNAIIDGVGLSPSNDYLPVYNFFGGDPNKIAQSYSSRNFVSSWGGTKTVDGVTYDLAVPPVGFSTGGTNPGLTEYVTSVYTNIFGREPDQGGLDYWVSQFNSPEAFGVGGFMGSDLGSRALWLAENMVSQAQGSFGDMLNINSVFSGIGANALFDYSDSNLWSKGIVDAAGKTGTAATKQKRVESYLNDLKAIVSDYAAGNLRSWQAYDAALAENAGWDELAWMTGATPEAVEDLYNISRGDKIKFENTIEAKINELEDAGYRSWEIYDWFSNNNLVTDNNLTNYGIINTLDLADYNGRSENSMGIVIQNAYDARDDLYKSITDTYNNVWNDRSWEFFDTGADEGWLRRDVMSALGIADVGNNYQNLVDKATQDKYVWTVTNTGTDLSNIAGGLSDVTATTGPATPESGIDQAAEDAAAKAIAEESTNVNMPTSGTFVPADLGGTVVNFNKKDINLGNVKDKYIETTVGPNARPIRLPKFNRQNNTIIEVPKFKPLEPYSVPSFDPKFKKDQVGMVEATDTTTPTEITTPSFINPTVETPKLEIPTFKPPTAPQAEPLSLFTPQTVEENTNQGVTAFKDGGEAEKKKTLPSLETVKRILEEADLTNPLDILLTPKSFLGAWAFSPTTLNEGEEEELARLRKEAMSYTEDKPPVVASRANGSPQEGEYSDEAFSGINTEGLPPSPVDEAVSDYIRFQSKAFTDPKAYVQAMGENLKKYHIDPLNEDPEKYLMENLGPGVIGAIKPRGGIMSFNPAKIMGTSETIPSNVQDVRKWVYNVKRDAEGNEITDEHRQALMEFVEKKYKNYLMTEFGTENDPLRKLIISANKKGERRFSPAFERDDILYGDVKDWLKKTEELETLKKDPQADAMEISRKADEAKQAYKAADISYDVASTVRPTAIMQVSKTKESFGAEIEAQNMREIILEFVRKPDTSPEKMYEDFADQALDLEQVNVAKRFADSLIKNANLMEAEGAKGALNMLKANLRVRPVFSKDSLPTDAVKQSIDNEIVFDLSEQIALGSLAPKELVQTLALIPPNKLKNMSFGQAMEKAMTAVEPSRNYLEIASRVEQGLSVPREQLFRLTTPVKEVKSNKGLQKWVALDDSKATVTEGKLMKHSVGGYNKEGTYGLGGKEAFDSGRAKIFSLRDDKTGEAIITLEYGRPIDSVRNEYKYPDKDYIRQIQGRFNSAPLDEINDILEFAKENNFDFPPGFIQTTYDRSATGSQLKNPIAIDWYELQKQYNKTGPVSIRPYDYDIDGLDSILYTTEQRGIADNLTDFKFAKGGMVDKPLYDRAA